MNNKDQLCNPGDPHPEQTAPRYVPPILYTRLKEAADKAWYPSEIKAAWDALFEFEIAMQDKYGDDIASDEWENILKELGF